MAALLDYYEVLQVSPNAEDEIIQAAYRRLALKRHPDRRIGDPSASEQMELLNRAYEVLSDPQKRREYDSRSRQSSKSRIVEEEPARPKARARQYPGSAAPEMPKAERQAESGPTSQKGKG